MPSDLASYGSAREAFSLHRECYSVTKMHAFVVYIYTLECRLGLQVLPGAVGAFGEPDDHRGHVAGGSACDGDYHQHGVNAGEKAPKCVCRHGRIGCLDG
jgi:hypothetical protein